MVRSGRVAAGADVARRRGDGEAPPGSAQREGDATAADADAVAYFRAIEDAFVRLRGAPLLLSPTDFQVASGWLRDGVPLSLVLSTLEEVFAKRQERGTRGRINSLRYCAPAVQAAWEELRELQGPARGEAAPEVPVAERLAALAGALPGGLPAREVWAARIQAVDGAAARGGNEAAEDALRALDAELLDAAREGLSAADRQTVEDEVAAIVDGLRDRFADAELAGLHDQLFRQRLRKRLGLPLLTLFG